MNITEIDYDSKKDISINKNKDIDNDTPRSNYTSKSNDTPRNRNALKHAQYLIDKNLIDVDDFADILEKIKDKKNEKEWNESYIHILSSICEKGQCYRYMHEKSSDYYSKLSNQFTYFSMIFSFLLSAFTLITTDLNIINSNIIILVSGIGHILIASLTGMQKKMNLPEYSESHSIAVTEFDTFCRNIEFQLKLPIEDRNIVPKYVFLTIDKYESIVSSSPKIPNKIIISFRHWASYNLTIDQPSIVKTFTPIHKLNENNIYYEKCNKKKYKKQGLKYMPEFINDPDICKLIKKDLSLKKTKKKKRKTFKIKKLFIDYINLKKNTLIKFNFNKTIDNEDVNSEDSIDSNESFIDSINSNDTNESIDTNESYIDSIDSNDTNDSK